MTTNTTNSQKKTLNLQPTPAMSGSTEPLGLSLSANAGETAAPSSLPYQPTVDLPDTGIANTGKPRGRNTKPTQPTRDEVLLAIAGIQTALPTLQAAGLITVTKRLIVTEVISANFPMKTWVYDGKTLSLVNDYEPVLVVLAEKKGE